MFQTLHSLCFFADEGVRTKRAGKDAKNPVHKRARRSGHRDLNQGIEELQAIQWEQVLGFQITYLTLLKNLHLLSYRALPKPPCHHSWS